MRGREPVKNKSVKNSTLSKNKNKNEIKVVCKLHFKPFNCCSWVPHLALLRDLVECDEDGEVGGADLGLGHALCHGAGDVDPAQPLHGVQVPIAS